MSRRNKLGSNERVEQLTNRGSRNKNESSKQIPKISMTNQSQSNRLPLPLPIFRSPVTSMTVNNTLRVEPFKFLAASHKSIRVRENYTVVEAVEPTSDSVYLARSLTCGESFCVSVTKVDKRRTDFSFIIGFTTCLPGSPHRASEPCSPTHCGGHSQQLKIFNANNVESKVTVERQSNGEIYFAIDSAMPIRIEFDRNSCDCDMVSENRLTPYIQLSGNVLTLTMVTNNIRKLNIATATSVRGELGSATAFGPRVAIQKRYSKSAAPPTAIDTEDLHQAFVSESDCDSKFIKWNYPTDECKLSVNQAGVLRKNERGERFVFYLDKILNVNAHVTILVTKIYDVDKYSGDFEFGVTTLSAARIKTFEQDFFVDSENVQNGSHRFVVQREAKLNDKFTFTRTEEGVIEVRKNNIVQAISRMGNAFKWTKNLLPFVILNEKVSAILSVNNAQSIQFGQEYEFPPTELKSTENVTLTNQTLLHWETTDNDGVIINAKPFDNVLSFIIRQVRTTTADHSMSFGVISSVKTGFKTLREISTCLDYKHDNLIPSPALGLKFSVFKTTYGKVTLKYNNGDGDRKMSLFAVDPLQCYHPVIILNGSVVAIELLPNPSKKTVKCTARPSTGAVRRPPADASWTKECKICMDRPIDSVFLPCGHRFACWDCGKAWMERGNNASNGGNRNCPVCRKVTDTLIRTYD